MNNCMLDLETFGTRPGSALRSIGAAFFEPRSIGFGQTFYANIDKQSCLDAGLIIDPKTEEWWQHQSLESQAQLEVNPEHLSKVISNFCDWFIGNGGRKIWCQGANFDAPLWEHAIWASGYAAPWKYYDVRDTRTVYELAGLDQRTISKVGTHHNALDDCKFQIICVQTAISRIEPRA